MSAPRRAPVRPDRLRVWTSVAIGFPPGGCADQSAAVRLDSAGAQSWRSMPGRSADDQCSANRPSAPARLISMIWNDTCRPVGRTPENSPSWAVAGDALHDPVILGDLVFHNGVEIREDTQGQGQPVPKRREAGDGLAAGDVVHAVGGDELI